VGAPAAPSNHSQLLCDLRTRSRDGPPDSVERLVALSLDVAGSLVHCEEIERVTVVRDLRLAVRALGRAEQRRVEPGAGGRLVVDERWPIRLALSVADALRALVGVKRYSVRPFAPTSTSPTSVAFKTTVDVSVILTLLSRAAGISSDAI
jgi:hypothetical protein